MANSLSEPVWDDGGGSLFLHPPPRGLTIGDSVLMRDGMATATRIETGAETETDPKPEVDPNVTPDPTAAPGPVTTEPEIAAPAAEPATVTAQAIPMTMERVRSIASLVELERTAVKTRALLFFMLGKEDVNLSHEVRSFTLEAALTCDFIQKRAAQIVDVLAGRIDVKDIKEEDI